MSECTQVVKQEDTQFSIQGTGGAAVGEAMGVWAHKDENESLKFIGTKEVAIAMIKEQLLSQSCSFLDIWGSLNQACNSGLHGQSHSSG